jgi:hypothetical protein
METPPSQSYPASVVPVWSFSSTNRWQVLPFVFAAVLAGLFFFIGANPAVWAVFAQWLYYPTWDTMFGDLGMTIEHFREAEAGADPLGDPNSEFAYPRAVLALRHLGLFYLPLPWLGALQAAAAMAGIIIVLRPTAVKRSIATMLLFLTPPMVLGFERANMDFALFLLCVAAAAIWSRTSAVQGMVWPILCLVAGALLKLYPAFALIGAAVAENGRRRLMCVLAVTVIVFYWAINAEELRLIAQKVPVATISAWGCLVFFARLEKFVNTDAIGLGGLGNIDWSTVGLITYSLGAIAACTIGLYLGRRLRSRAWPPREWCYYWTGAAICCGSFVGANYAYRWIFAILTIPLLIRCAYDPDRHVASWARITLAALICSFIAPLIADRWVFLLTQVANWTFILCLVVGGVALRTATRQKLKTETLKQKSGKRKPLSTTDYGLPTTDSQLPTINYRQQMGDGSWQMGDQKDR